MSRMRLGTPLRLWPRRLLAMPVRAYRFFLSPWLGSACRFEPTCSRYALDALDRHGAGVGAYLAARRLLRCHPWCEGGVDPVPPLPLATPTTPTTPTNTLQDHSIS